MVHFISAAPKKENGSESKREKDPKIELISWSLLGGNFLGATNVIKLAGCGSKNRESNERTCSFLKKFLGILVVQKRLKIRKIPEF